MTDQKYTGCYTIIDNAGRRLGAESWIPVVKGSRRPELQRPEPHTGPDTQDGSISPKGCFGRECALALHETVAHIDAAEGGLGGHPGRGGGGNGHYHPRDPRLNAHLGLPREYAAEIEFVAGSPS